MGGRPSEGIHPAGSRGACRELHKEKERFARQSSAQAFNRQSAGHGGTSRCKSWKLAFVPDLSAIVFH
jgi:hypothetical protein